MCNYYQNNQPKWLTFNEIFHEKKEKEIERKKRVAK